MKFAHLSGLIAAPHTPFDRKGEINLPEIRKQAAWLVKSGVKGAYISGTTGEGISCSVAERKEVMEEWVRLAKGKLYLIIHAGALSIKDAQELIAHAQAIGADATSVVPANFFKPDSVNILVDYLKAIAACAPKLPFYYYHTMASGVKLPMVPFLEMAEKKIPNLAGIKFNHHDLHEYQNCRRACGGKFDITWGVDEFFLGAIALGAQSAIGSTYNYAAPLYLDIWDKMRKGRMAAAQAGMIRVCRIVDLLNIYGGVPCGKALMAVRGIDVGDPRLPLKALTAAEKKFLVARGQSIFGGYRA